MPMAPSKRYPTAATSYITLAVERIGVISSPFHPDSVCCLEMLGLVRTIMQPGLSGGPRELLMLTALLAAHHLQEEPSSMVPKQAGPSFLDVPCPIVVHSLALTHRRRRRPPTWYVPTAQTASEHRSNSSHAGTGSAFTRQIIPMSHICPKSTTESVHSAIPCNWSICSTRFYMERTTSNWMAAISFFLKATRRVISSAPYNNGAANTSLGYGFHGDFLNGWDMPTQTAALSARTWIMEVKSVLVNH